MRYLLLTLTFTSLAVAQEPKTAPPLEESKAVVVPFDLLPSGHFVVKVKLNGEGPFRMVFDTGAPLTLIDTKAGKAASLTKKKEGGGGLLGMFTGGLNQVEVGKLEVGTALAEKTSAIVMDHPTVKAISDAFEDQGGPIQGIVGFPFFAKFATTVDYEKKQLVLKPNGYKPGDYLQDMMNGLMKAEERNKPRVVSNGTVWGFAAEKEAQDEKPGIEVARVYDDSPAAKAGLMAGDRLITIDGRWTDSQADLLIALGRAKSGQTVPVVVQRGGKQVEMKITPKSGY
jgi:hypothetical protein